MVIVIGHREEDNIEGLTFKYSLGQHVKYQGKIWMIFKHEKKNGGPAYLLDLLEDDTTFIDNVAESELEDCEMKLSCCYEFINEAWERFVYDGNNTEASKWIINNIIKKINNINEMDFHHNQESTEYWLHIKHNSEEYTWTKQKT